jgi:hypothetical protein
VLACYPKASRRESEEEILGQGTGEDAWPVTWPDLISTMALWLVGLVAGLLIVSETASPYYQHRAATRAATPANGTER